MPPFLARLMRSLFAVDRRGTYLEEVRFQRLAEIPDCADDYSLIASSAAGDGSLLFLFAAKAGAGQIEETDAISLATSRRVGVEPTRRYRLSIWRPNSSLVTVDLPDLALKFPGVDIFPDGRILIFASRCSWYGPNDHDTSGAIYDPLTRKVSRILLGDGIESAYVDSLGRIWVAYFDEGVSGNCGWGHEGPVPIGAAGLVCFSDTGEKIWEFPTAGVISDCDALNISGSEAAIFFSDDFPVCRISNRFEPSHWKTNLEGCREFAIHDDAVLFTGQFNDPPDIGYLGRLQADGTMSGQQVRLLMPDGLGLPRGRFLGRGRHLYFFDAHNVYRTSLG